MRTELELLRLAYEELLELRGYLCDVRSNFDPRIDKLKKYWESKKPEWEKELRIIQNKNYEKTK